MLRIQIHLQVSKRTLFDPKLNCSNGCATNVCHQCEFQVVSMCLSRALTVIQSNQSPDARPGRIRLAWVQSVGWWRCDFRMKRNRSPDAQIWVFGEDLGDCGSSIHTHTVSIPTISGANSDDWRARSVTPRLLRIHAVLAIFRW